MKTRFRGYGVLIEFSVRAPCRRVIGDNKGRLQSVVEREEEWREISVIKEEGLS
jgi:hypothetical protein